MNRRGFLGLSLKAAVVTVALTTGLGRAAINVIKNPWTITRERDTAKNRDYYSMEYKHMEDGREITYLQDGWYITDKLKTETNLAHRLSVSRIKESKLCLQRYLGRDVPDQFVEDYIQILKPLKEIV